MMKTLQDKLLAKMDNEEEEKMPYSADDQVTLLYLTLTDGRLIRTGTRFGLRPNSVSSLSPSRRKETTFLIRV